MRDKIATKLSKNGCSNIIFPNLNPFKCSDNLKVPKINDQVCECQS